MSNAPGRVLVAHPFPDLYGADRMLLQALRALRSRGTEVTVVVPEPGPLLPTLAEAGIAVVVAPFPVVRRAAVSPRGLARLAAGLPGDLARLHHLLGAQRPDALYVNTLTLPHWLAAARLARLPVICHVREAPEDLPGLARKALAAPLLLATRVVANSHATARHLARSWPSLARRTSVVHNGLDFPGPCPPPAPHPGPARLLVAGRISPTKGQDVALEAVARLVAERRDVVLEVVGSTFRGYEWFQDGLRRRAEELGIAERVRFLGFRAPLWETYASADVVLVPSRSESFGNVAVEAMAMARPVVATRVGALPDLVDHGATGLVCAPADPAGMAAAVARLLDDAEAAGAIGQRASSSVRRRFPYERFERDFLEVVDEVLADRPARPAPPRVTPA